jgi:nicotinate-nucleotide--dimethylbenzimidazole phosphoribosyltransferase
MNVLLQRTLAEIRPVNETARRVATDRQAVLTKPPGSLGRLEEIAVDAAGIMSSPEPSPEPGALVLAAADHGVSKEGVSAYPREVTAQMVHNFLAEGAAINAIAGSVGAKIFLVDAGIDAEMPVHAGLYQRKASRGTANFAEGPAMSKGQAAAIVESGIEFVHGLCERGYKAVAVGDMGIGNTTSAAVVTAMITGASAASVTGRGTMVRDDQYQRKIEVVRRALCVHRVDPGDGLAVLAAVGGYETGFLTGCLVGAASRRVPVLLDGFPTTAAALIAARLQVDIPRYCFAGHLSQEPGHRIALDFLGLRPLLNLDMRLGEGTGAVLGMSIVQAACRCLNEMATFSEAAVRDRIA